MEKIVTYRAYDGKEFDSYADCMEYEDKIKQDFRNTINKDMIDFIANNKNMIIWILTKLKTYCGGFIGCNGCIFDGAHKSVCSCYDTCTLSALGNTPPEDLDMNEVVKVLDKIINKED